MSADVLRKMRGMGLSLDQAIELLDAMAVAKQPNANALRQRRFRERRAQGVTDNVTSNATDNVTDPSPLPSSPQTPQQPTPTPGDINTRAAREREDAAFGRFWSAYPRKVSKADARKAFGRAWRKLPPMDEEPILTGGLERAKAAWTDAQFIPHAATWLNGERWQDEPDPITPASVNERTAPNRPDKRRAAFAERLGDIDAAMAVAFEQPRGGH